MGSEGVELRDTCPWDLTHLLELKESRATCFVCLCKQESFFGSLKSYGSVLKKHIGFLLAPLLSPTSLAPTVPEILPSDQRGWWYTGFIFVGATEFQGVGVSGVVLNGVPPGEGGEIPMPVPLPSACAPSNWLWRVTACLKRWPRLLKTAPRTVTVTCCPVSLRPLLTSSPAVTLSTPHPPSLRRHKALSPQRWAPWPLLELPGPVGLPRDFCPWVSHPRPPLCFTDAGLFPQMTGPVWPSSPPRRSQALTTSTPVSCL